MRKLKEAAALLYDSEKDSAPVVIASGRGYIADKIISIAKENDIKIFENEYVSNVLCNLPIDAEIPEDLYKAVAEIFAYILKLDKNT